MARLAERTDLRSSLTGRVRVRACEPASLVLDGGARAATLALLTALSELEGGGAAR